MRVDVLIRNARVVTVAGENRARRGAAMRELGVIERGAVAVREGRIVAVEDADGFLGDVEATQVVDARGRVLMPGFVDCHTHACWAGDRLNEFQMKLEGADYLSILRAGGGIMSTVRATRAASVDELACATVGRLGRMLSLGTTTAEVKTGYGLSTDAELMMLDAIEAAASNSPVQVVPTFLGAHAVDRERADSVERTIEETLPVVAARRPGIFCDAYCEEGAWSLDDTRRLFERARALGCPLRIHTDQFNSLGATRMAVEMGARSVDHLEATTEADVELIARSATIAVALPISGFQVDDRYAPGRRLVDAGAALAIASNYNPGSAPSPSMPFAVGLACRKLKLTPAEAIVAATINGACVLGLEAEVGSIAVGKRADLVLWDELDERAIAYEVASVPARWVMTKGRVAYGALQ